MGFSYAATGAGTLVRTGEERATLVRRTYALLFSGILVTIGGAFFATTQPAVMQAVVQHPFITFIVLFLPLLAAQRSPFPANIGLMYLYNLGMGIFLAPVLLFYARVQPGVLGEAGFLTAGMFGVLTLYATVSKRDFSAWGGFFVVGLFVLIAASLLNLFFHSSLAQTWIAAFTVFIFGGLLVYDTWRIQNRFGPNDYVPAALMIYLDVLNIFLALLQLLGGSGSRRR
jgi:FtsH-binding integral membrane protein